MKDVAIRTVGLTRQFRTVTAVDGLTLDVPAGTVFGFLGPNGAGKTTTIHLLLGILAATRGRAEVLGYDVATQPAAIRRSVGALLEHHGLYERLSAEQNLEFYARIHRLGPADGRRRVRELLEGIGLWDRRKEAVAKWSKGMKQKLAVARAVFNRPRLVFLDEPTAGQDPASAAALREEIQSLARRDGVTVFLTTHNLGEAERICDRVGVIQKGRLLTLGAPETLRRRAARPRLEVVGRNFSPRLVAQLQRRPGVASVAVHGDRLVIDLDDHGDSAPLVAAIIRAGGEVEEVVKPRATLEEVFLGLVEAPP